MDARRWSLCRSCDSKATSKIKPPRLSQLQIHSFRTFVVQSPMSCSTVVNFSTRHERQEMPLESLQAEAWIWCMWRIQTYPNVFNRICFAHFSSVRYALIFFENMAMSLAKGLDMNFKMKQWLSPSVFGPSFQLHLVQTRRLRSQIPFQLSSNHDHGGQRGFVESLPSK